MLTREPGSINNLSLRFLLASFLHTTPETVIRSHQAFQRASASSDPESSEQRGFCGIGHVTSLIHAQATTSPQHTIARPSSKGSAILVFHRLCLVGCLWLLQMLALMCVTFCMSAVSEFHAVRNALCFCGFCHGDRAFVEDESWNLTLALHRSIQDSSSNTQA